MTNVFLRDGFIDRYRGDRLVYPAALRLISSMLPKVFPYHKNGKMDVGHIAYWELFPTIDHIVPVARGGVDDESNWVCCSMLTNGIKSNWLLDELRWNLLQPGSLEQWDGMLSWFIGQMERSPEYFEVSYLKAWYNAAKSVARNKEFNTPASGLGRSASPAAR